jgi:hypothetical protein
MMGLVIDVVPLIVVALSAPVLTTDVTDRAPAFDIEATVVPGTD